jgi:hypothetical protein
MFHTLVDLVRNDFWYVVVLHFFVLTIKQFGSTDLLALSLFWIGGSRSLLMTIMSAFEEESHIKKFVPVTYRNHIKHITEFERDLEEWTTSNLTWSGISVRRTLYLSLVHSQLCYGSQVWAPQSVNLIKRTERVQRRVTKYILDFPFFCEVSYNQRFAF